MFLRMFRGLLFDCCTVFTQGEGERELEREKKRIREILPWTYQSAIPLKKLFLTGQKDLSHLSPCSDLIHRYICVLLKSSQRGLPSSYLISEYLSDESPVTTCVWLSLPNSLCK